MDRPTNQSPASAPPTGTTRWLRFDPPHAATPRPVLLDRHDDDPPPRDAAEGR